MNENTFDKQMAEFEKRYLSPPKAKKKNPFSTGFNELDDILSGGIPKGCITEIYGARDTGKTTLALNIIKQAQKKEKISLYFDCDYSWDREYARKVGIDFETVDVIVSKPNEYMLQAIEKLIDKDLIDLIVIDTITSLAIGRKQLFNILKKLSGKIKKNNITVILLSQIRHKFSKEETVIYKELMEFYVTLRIHMKYISSKKRDGKLLYKCIKVDIVQNKLDNEKKSTIINIGINNE